MIRQPAQQITTGHAFNIYRHSNMETTSNIYPWQLYGLLFSFA
jgi:hypothetical protein